MDDDTVYVILNNLIKDLRNLPANFYLTIQDVTELKQNQTIKLLCVDRNFSDHMFSAVKNDQGCEPEQLFRSAICEYKHQTEMKGQLRWPHDDIDIMNFEFDVEYKPNNWYPFKNGILPAQDEQGLAKLLDCDLKWSSFEPQTRVGWRGCMIKWDKFAERK